MYGCESWTVKKAERRRIDAFELWCWRRLLRVPWTGTSVFPWSETGILGNFWGRIKGANTFSHTHTHTHTHTGMGLNHQKGMKSHSLQEPGETFRGYYAQPRWPLELRRHSRVTTGISAFPLGWPWEAQSSPRVARESWGPSELPERRSSSSAPRRGSAAEYLYLNCGVGEDS